MEEQSNYIYGKNAIIEAIASGREIEKIFVSFSSKGNAGRIFSKAKKAKVQCVTYDKRKFGALEKIACPQGAKTQGVIALVSLIETISLNELLEKSKAECKYPILVALDGITDPQNLGAIARSVECSGASGIILPERGSATISPTAMKTSAGALEHVAVAKAGNLSQALDKAKDAGFWIVGTEMKSEKDYDANIYDCPLVLVIGSEGKGIRPSIRNHCDMFISIPLKGKIESLNASVSAGIVLFERLRQMK